MLINYVFLFARWKSKKDNLDLIRIHSSSFRYSVRGLSIWALWNTREESRRGQRGCSGWKATSWRSRFVSQQRKHVESHKFSSQSNSEKSRTRQRDHSVRINTIRLAIRPFYFCYSGYLRVYSREATNADSFWKLQKSRKEFKERVRKHNLI